MSSSQALKTLVSLVGQTTVEQAGLVRQMRSDGESEAAIEREETLLRELRAKLKAAEQAIADAKR